MESALIVSGSQKGIDYISKMLTSAAYEPISVVSSGGQARRYLLERYAELTIINAPLSDESGESLARHIATQGAGQVLLIVKSEFVDAISAATENDGVLTIAKPINPSVFWSAIKLARAAHHRINRMQAENMALQQKIEDIRIIDRAKCALISYLRMDEKDAHRYIEKRAMDMRVTKRAVAEALLKSYER